MQEQVKNQIRINLDKDSWKDHAKMVLGVGEGEGFEQVLQKFLKEIALKTVNCRTQSKPA